MKIGYKDIDYFIKSPPNHIKAVLIYGPDQGLVKERSELIGKTVVPDLNDPFLVKDLSLSQISDDLTLLTDELNGMSMLGGRQLIRITQADDKALQSCKNALEDYDGDNFIIIEAGELGPRSPLRVFFEKEKNGAALPCYVEDGRGLEITIKNILNEEGKALNPDALNFLARNLKGDRLMIRREIEKLALYAHDKPTISLEDCEQAIGIRGETGFNEVVFAVANGNLKELEKKLNQAFDEGFPPQALIRSLQNHLKRLYLAKLFVMEGKNSKEAMESIHPKVFFKEQPAFSAQMNNWSIPVLERAFDYLSETEKESKSSNLQAELICQDSFFKLARFAQKK